MRHRNPVSSLLMNPERPFLTPTSYQTTGSDPYVAIPFRHFSYGEIGSVYQKKSIIA